MSTISKYNCFTCLAYSVASCTLAPRSAACSTAKAMIVHSNPGSLQLSKGANVKHSCSTTPRVVSGPARVEPTHANSENECPLQACMARAMHDNAVFALPDKATALCRQMTEASNFDGLSVTTCSCTAGKIFPVARILRNLGIVGHVLCPGTQDLRSTLGPSRVAG